MSAQVLPFAAQAVRRICPCGCNRLAQPGDPGYGRRMTIFGKSGYWRKACILRLAELARHKKGRSAGEAAGPCVTRTVTSLAGLSNPTG